MILFLHLKSTLPSNINFPNSCYSLFVDSLWTSSRGQSGEGDQIPGLPHHGCPRWSPNSAMIFCLRHASLLPLEIDRVTFVTRPSYPWFQVAVAFVMIDSTDSCSRCGSGTLSLLPVAFRTINFRNEARKIPNLWSFDCNIIHPLFARFRQCKNGIMEEFLEANLHTYI